MKKGLIFSFIVLLETSCYDQKTVEATFKFPVVQPKIVVNCIITPSDSIFASVHKLLNVYDKSASFPNYNDGINNASVILENTTTSKKITLSFLSENGLYGNSQNNFKISPGANYRLTVLAPNYPTVIATCKVPEKAAVFDRFSYSEPYNAGTSINRRRVEGRWQGIVSSDSLYYGVNLVSQLQYNSEINSFSITEFSNNITKSSNIYFYQSTATNNQFPKIYTLLTAEKNLYFYYVSSERIENITKSGTGDFFGAFQGIIPEYTNIKNGYGVFGAFLGTKTKVLFK